jgi:hypothetical protein
MKNNHKVSIVLLFTALYTILFYQQTTGINLLIFELVYLIFAYRSTPGLLKNTLSLVITFGTLLTAIFTVIVNSSFVIMYNFISMFLLSGILILPNAVSIISAGGLAFYNMMMAQTSGFRQLLNHKSNLNPVRKTIRYIKIIVIPIGIILIFIGIYRIANPVFNEYAGTVFTKIGNYISLITEQIDFWLVTTIIFGYVVSNILVMQNPMAEVLAYDRRNDQLIRIRHSFGNRSHFRVTALKNEYRSAIFLFSILNLLILFVNIIDINWVWFNFQWTGQYLKQFVHEGTWMLIISILISMALVLFYFRGNLNFLSKNRTLRYLCYAWLIQNCILVISVGIRNLYYIEHFALAYKRIGVLIFLALAMFGLLSILYKIMKTKSAFYTLRINGLAFYILLLFMSFFNWDSIIARYNLAHYKTAFVHLDFLADLSSTALPEMVKTPQEWEEIQKQQASLFHFDYDYMSAPVFQKIIEDRKAAFKSSWEAKSFLSWNYAEYKAYHSM